MTRKDGATVKTVTRVWAGETTRFTITIKDGRFINITRRTKGGRLPYNAGTHEEVRAAWWRVLHMPKPA